MVIANYRLGFSGTDQAGKVNTLPIHGRIPTWLRGNLTPTGPGTFAVGKHSYHHWFDGLAMLHKFSFEDGMSPLPIGFLKVRLIKKPKSKAKSVAVNLVPRLVIHSWNGCAIRYLG